MEDRMSGLKDKIEIKGKRSEEYLTKDSRTEKRCPFRYRKPTGHQTDMTKIKPLQGKLYLKQLVQKMRKEY
jgi:hypothetical protein